jgi:predicted metal-dependent peptidase
MDTLPQRVSYTPEQEEKMTAARVAFYKVCPFFCSFYYDQLVEYPTNLIPTAATDGKRVFLNPDYVCALQVQEMVFVLAHETYHAVWRHSVRGRYYRRTGMIDDMVYSHDLFNECADYIINADLVELTIGQINSTWLFDPDVKGNMLVEDIYRKYYKPPPPNEGGTDGQNQAPSTGTKTGGSAGRSRPAKHRGRGTRPDKVAEANGGGFDEVYDPFVEPVTGKDDIASEQQFKEAIARATAVAKAIGKMPGQLQRVVDEILEPQVNWREHVRLLITGKVGNTRETWLRPNRRRLVLNPLVFMPGKTGYGCELVAVWIDNSGSVGQAEYHAFFSEVGGIMNDVRPKRLFVGWCDAKVQRVEWCSSLDEVHNLHYKPTPGGGGTSFVPPFEYMEEHDIRPETMVYLTDLMGGAPKQPPPYPVIWCASTDLTAPWGETVRIKP